MGRWEERETSLRAGVATGFLGFRESILVPGALTSREHIDFGRIHEDQRRKTGGAVLPA